MERIHYPVALLLLLSACGGNGGDGEKSTPGLVIGGDDAGASPASLYQMPTPNELFTLVRDLAGEGHKRLLNPVTYADKYVSRKARAINFGIYSTDLIYASSFHLNVEVARYYLTTKKLADGLGISAAFNDADFVRLEKNIARGDSLEVISNHVYLKAYEQLEQEEMGPVLSLVLAGGWIESMHLLISQVEAFGRSDAFADRIAEQKVTLEHLIEIMKMHESDADVNEMRQRLIEIRDIYDSMDLRTLPQQAEPVQSDRLVISADTEPLLTDDIYKQLLDSIGALREELITPEDRPRS